MIVFCCPEVVPDVYGRFSTAQDVCAAWRDFHGLSRDDVGLKRSGADLVVVAKRDGLQFKSGWLESL